MVGISAVLSSDALSSRACGEERIGAAYSCGLSASEWVDKMGLVHLVWD